MDFNTLLSIIFMIALLWYIYFHLKRRRLYKLASSFNGPRPLPIIGNILKCKIQPAKLREQIVKNELEYSSPMRIWLGPYLVIFVWDPDNTELVLNNAHAFNKSPYFSKLLEFIIGPGLATLPVTEWRQHRKLIAPMFNQKYFNGFFDNLCKHSKRMVDNLQDRVNGDTFDAHSYLASYAIKTAIELILDYSEDDGGSVNIDIVMDSLKIMLSCMTERVAKMWFLPDCIFYLTSCGKKAIEAKRRFDAVVASIIEHSKKEYLYVHLQNNGQELNAGVNRPKKLLDYLLAPPDGSATLTAEEVEAEVATFILAALETTTSVTGYILLVLAIYPDIQERLYQEVRQTLGSKKDLVYEDLKHLQYLDRVIKETLRIFPTLAGLIRYADKEICLKNHTVPANTTIVLGAVNLHMNPNIWPKPFEFNPDRFLPEEEAKRHAYSYLPFSAGPRNCIGMRFASLSLKTAVSTFVLNYKVMTTYKSVDDIHLTLTLDFQATDGFKISITPR